MAIAPDTTDWTWVLTRACPECGFDTRSVAGSDVAGLIRANADEWMEVLDRGPEIRFRVRPDRWSALEYACHVRDVFRVFDERLRLMVETDDPRFANWDQDATAIADRYELQSPDQVGPQLQTAAASLADHLDCVAPDAWGRTGVRSDGAHFSVETLARYLIHDPIHHLHDVNAVL